MEVLVLPNKNGTIQPIKYCHSRVGMVPVDDINSELEPSPWQFSERLSYQCVPDGTALKR